MIDFLLQRYARMCLLFALGFAWVMWMVDADNDAKARRQP